MKYRLRTLPASAWHAALQAMSRRRCFGSFIPFEHQPTLWFRLKTWEYIGLN